MGQSRMTDSWDSTMNEKIQTPFGEMRLSEFVCEIVRFEQQGFPATAVALREILATSVAAAAPAKH